MTTTFQEIPCPPKLTKNKLSQTSEDCKQLALTLDSLELISPKIKKQTKSQKQRAPEILESVLNWFEKRDIREGYPDSLKEARPRDKIEQMKKTFSIEENSGLLSRRMKKALTIFA